MHVKVTPIIVKSHRSLRGTCHAETLHAITYMIQLNKIQIIVQGTIKFYHISTAFFSLHAPWSYREKVQNINVINDKKSICVSLCCKP